jgi:hypothetical protein
MRIKKLGVKLNNFGLPKTRRNSRNVYAIVSSSGLLVFAGEWLQDSPA